MAQDKLAGAECLYNEKFYNDAYYLAGYAAEFAFKAAICSRLDIEMFDESQVNKRISEPLKIHSLETLLIYSGLSRRLQTDKAVNIGLDQAWSIVSGWKEDRRYEAGPYRPQTVRRFLDATKIFLQWIQSHW